MKWFDRQFSFDQPDWMYPNVVERLRGTPARVAELVTGVEVSALTRRDEDGWSIQENLGHLLDLEPLWSGRLDDLLRGESRLREADLTNRRTHEANHNATSLDELLTAFRQIRSEFVARLDGLESSASALSALHPRLEQPMRLLDHLFFIAEHDDHHLAQMSRLKRRFS